MSFKIGAGSRSRTDNTSWVWKCKLCCIPSGQKCKVTVSSLPINLFPHKNLARPVGLEPTTSAFDSLRFRGLLFFQLNYERFEFFLMCSFAVELGRKHVHETGLLLRNIGLTGLSPKVQSRTPVQYGKPQGLPERPLCIVPIGCKRAS